MIRSIAFVAAASALLCAPANAHEGMDMGGMETPAKTAPTKPKPAQTKKTPAKPKTAPTATQPMIDPTPRADAAAMPPPQAIPQAAPPEAVAAPIMSMDMSAHGSHGDDATQMNGLLGAYGMRRDASGTSWQPEAAPHDGLHGMAGDWMLMGHLTLYGVYDWQNGPRGDDKAFAAGMIMGSARRDFANGGILNLRAMLSPDPFMGKAGYPLLLAAGETADGATLLVDRQHPHDLFMELSASYAHPITAQDSVFVYAGLPGEPAFGPPAFMHRITAMDSPEAPISHHWLDSTHVSFGVITLGWVHDDWKVEASSFRGREPDEKRFDIESPRLDSESVRVSWNPSKRWALQASWADLKSPEALHPDEDETRWSASATYVLPLGQNGSWSAMAAFGRKQHGDQDLDAWILETAWRPDQKWTAFGRYEALENSELALAPASAGAENVSRLSLGVVRDFQVREHVTFGIGGLVSRNFVSDALSASYDGDQNGAMAFVRLRVQ